MKVIASYNIKGGVGKTATTVNLAHHAARMGARTLIWDLDPQGAASYYFKVKPRVKGGFEKFVQQKKRRPEHAIRGTDFEGLDLIPADFSARHMDVVLDRSKKPTRLLKRLIKRFGREYDVLFLDCAPSIGVASECLFDVADVLVVPTIPTTLSINTLEQLKKHLRRRPGKAPEVLPFFSMVDDRKAMHRKVVRNAKELAYKPLKSRIPYSSTVEKMGVHRAPVHAFASKSKPARAYTRLGNEIQAHLN